MSAEQSSSSQPINNISQLYSLNHQGQTSSFTTKTSSANPAPMNLTKEQSQNIKGLGILVIMIHNFVSHMMVISCNETSYSQDVTDAFVNNVFSSSSLWYIFSFAGWIGVPLFFFLSGYGLSKKYGQANLDTWKYIKSHAIKLWQLIIPVYLLYILVYHFCFGRPLLIKNFIGVVTFTANLQGDAIINPLVYWFFGVIFQFYLLYLLFRKLNVKQLWVLFFAFMVVNYLILYFIPDRLAINTNLSIMGHSIQFDMGSIWARSNFIGWGMPFVLGMIAARTDFSLPKKWSIAVSIVSLVMVLVCLSVKALSPLGELVAILCAVTLVQWCTFRSIAWVGLISASIYVVHPFVRMVLYLTVCRPHGETPHPLAVTMAFVIITLALSWLHHKLLKKFNSRQR